MTETRTTLFMFQDMSKGQFGAFYSALYIEILGPLWDTMALLSGR